MNPAPPRTEYIYSDTYLGWRLGFDHPTQARRAANTLDVLRQLRAPMRVVEPTPADVDDLLLVHDETYVGDVLAGYSDEWGRDRRPDLGHVASIMFGGTLDAARRIITGETVRAFNPQGAKHHAHHDRGGGFCVFNDTAAAARLFTDAGMRVAILDWDAHHGDGVEELCRDNDDILTASIHNGAIWPHTGHTHDPERHVYNWPLPPGADNRHLVDAVDAALGQVAGFMPDVIVLVAGADGHVDDPLGGLAYTPDGVVAAMRRVMSLARDLCDDRILAGGAGGYRPDDATPAMWVATFAALTTR